MPVTVNRYAASKSRYFSDSSQPEPGIMPMPRQFRSVTEKTSASIRRASGLPSRCTARGYAFSTSARPASSCRTVLRMPSRMSSGSNPVTTIGTWYFSASGA